jgi:hypothetical protein
VVHIGVVLLLLLLLLLLKLGVRARLQQSWGLQLKLCFSNSVLQRGVRVSERRKCVMVKEFYRLPQNLCLRIKIRVATLDTNHSIADNTHIINHCFSPEAS